jgi:RimJ/RimL family protein N-acetyltransferase
VELTLNRFVVIDKKLEAVRLVISIREASVGDNDTLVKLQRECPMGTKLVLGVDSSPDYFARSKPFNDGRVLVAIDDDTIVGSAAYSIDDSLVGGRLFKTTYEYGFMVDPKHRRKGTAQQLQEQIEQIALGRNVDLLYLTIIEDNLPSIRLFSKMGFKKAKDCLTFSRMAYKRTKTEETRIRSMEEADVHDVTRLINDTYRDYNLFKPFEPSGFLDYVRRIPHFGLGNILVFDDDRDIKACLGYWNYNRVRRYIVQRMTWKLRAQMSMMRLAGLFTKVPHVPTVGEPLQSYNLATMAYKDPTAIMELLKHVINIASENKISFLHASVDPTSPIATILTQFRHTSVKLHVFTRSIRQEIFPNLSEGKLYIDVIDL